MKYGLLKLGLVFTIFASCTAMEQVSAKNYFMSGQTVRRDVYFVEKSQQAVTIYDVFRQPHFVPTQLVAVGSGNEREEEMRNHVRNFSLRLTLHNFSPDGKYALVSLAGVFYLLTFQEGSFEQLSLRPFTKDEFDDFESNMRDLVDKWGKK